MPETTFLPTALLVVGTFALTGSAVLNLVFRPPTPVVASTCADLAGNTATYAEAAAQHNSAAAKAYAGFSSTAATVTATPQPNASAGPLTYSLTIKRTGSAVVVSASPSAAVGCSASADTEAQGPDPGTVAQ